MVKATLLLDFKAMQGDLLIQMALWQLPGRTRDRPHGFKYRLHDNETGKGDHRHRGEDEAEEPYVFSTLDVLLDDFRKDCEQLGWRWDE